MINKTDKNEFKEKKELNLKLLKNFQKKFNKKQKNFKNNLLVVVLPIHVLLSKLIT